MLRRVWQGPPLCVETDVAKHRRCPAGTGTGNGGAPLNDARSGRPSQAAAEAEAFFLNDGSHRSCAMRRWLPASAGRRSLG
jgi:hypothetical protein